MTKEKQLALVAFKKARGQIEKIIKMVETDAYCVEIMQQNLAAIGLLKSAHQAMLENHLKTCFSNPRNLKNKNQIEKMIKELSQVVKLFNK
ncbi:MAG: metal-sensing transcriptional repressor [Patescibacteria group bacterium]|nr:metal-sensing transcriptional repressor [Patescibacteria group bacterium]